MSTGYSAHPVLASEQLKNAEKTKNAKNQATTSTTKTTAVNSKSQRHSPQHRHRQHKTNSSIDEGGTTTTSTTIRGFFNFSPFKSKTKIAELATTTAPKAVDKKVVDENMPPTPMRATTPQKTLPVRTTSRQQQHRSFPDDTNYEPDDDDDEDEYDAHGNDDDEDDDTKDCVDSAAPPLSKTENLNEPIIRHDQLQHRLSRANRQTNLGFDDLMNVATSTKTFQQTAQPQTPIAAPKAATKSIPAFSDGCPSGFSSTISSPSPSTVSSPLSTPTRLTTQLQLQHSHHNHQLHQHCCRKSSPGALSTLHQNHHHLHHHHHHHHHHLASSAAAAAAGSDSSSLSAASGCKKLQKFDPRFGPSPYRQLLPILLCILSFATVFTILIIYMDTTEIRHQQFRLNMSRDYDLYGVAQDDPDLVTFLREIHMRKYSTYFLKNRIDPTSASTASAPSSSPSIVSGGLNFSAQHVDGLVPEMAHYVAELLGGKMNGAVIQSLTGAVGHLTTAPWLSETLNWAGIIVEPEPRRYFTLRKQHMQRAHMQVVHACVSPNPYPKEVTIHNEESEVRINSLLDAELSWFNSRVKCFPLYTIMLACNRVEYDLLSLGVHGHELEILQTLPYDKIKIEVISIHLQDNLDKTPRGYIQKITKFLTGKGYKLQKKFGSNYFYQRINTTNRTRKKDILLLKTP